MAREEADRRRVLAIEDSAVTRRLLEAQLAALGYEALLAGDGEQGLELAARERPDAILLDLQLPGVDGLEVCRRLRSAPATAGIPVLFLTGAADIGSRVAGFEAGADDYVTKPFEPRELGARLGAHLALFRQRQQLAAVEGVFGTLRMLAHEFNNPLQAVVGGLQMATDASQNALHRVEGLQMARDGVERLTELAHRLHNLAEPVFKPSPIGPMLDVAASPGHAETASVTQPAGGE